MRILHVSSARAFGGGERHLADLSNALAERGHDVFAALAPLSPLRDKLTILPGQNLITLPLRNSLDVASAFQLARHLRRHRIEILHAHMARDYLPAVLAARWARGVQLVLTRHVLFPLGKFHRATLAHAARVIAVSEGVARALCDQRLLPARKITIIPNGIDLRRFDMGPPRAACRQEWRRRLNLRGRLVVGMVGEISPVKGQEDFLQAAALIVERHPEVDFVIAGEDASRTGERRARIERLIDQLGLAGRVHLTGWLDQTGPLLSALDVFVSAARSESFGLAMVEAMACGAPVVATRTAGACEIIDDGVTGVLVPIGDVRGLAQAIGELLEDPQRRAHLRERARAEIVNRFSLEKMVDATERLYSEVLAGNRSEGRRNL